MKCFPGNQFHIIKTIIKQFNLIKVEKSLRKDTFDEFSLEV
jgi:hypothetical protein